jgi:hypothetical protein
MIGNVLDDAPIGLAFAQRCEYLVKPLNAPFGASERAFLFEARAGWKYYVGKLACLAEEDVLGNEKIELGEPILNEVGVGILYADGNWSLSIARTQQRAGGDRSRGASGSSARVPVCARLRSARAF